MRAVAFTAALVLLYTDVFGGASTAPTNLMVTKLLT
jgi:hypothetical protein